MVPATNREIALRVVKGTDPPGSLLDETYRRFSPYVAAVALRLSGRVDDLEDLVQDVFLAAARGIKKMRNADAIKGWLATVTVRMVGRRLQVRRVRRLLGLDRDYDYLHVV